MAYELIIADHDGGCFSVRYGHAFRTVQKHKVVNGKHWWNRPTTVRKSDEELRADLNQAAFQAIERHRQIVDERNTAKEMAEAVTATVLEIDEQTSKL